MRMFSTWQIAGHNRRGALRPLFVCGGDQFACPLVRPTRCLHRLVDVVPNHGKTLAVSRDGQEDDQLLVMEVLDHGPEEMQMRLVARGRE